MWCRFGSTSLQDRANEESLGRLWAYVKHYENTFMDKHGMQEYKKATEIRTEKGKKINAFYLVCHNGYHLFFKYWENG